jgi:hypothetical protein
MRLFVDLTVHSYVIPANAGIQTINLAATIER